MKRKNFIKASAALATGSLIASFSSCLPEKREPALPANAQKIRKNWAGNYQYRAKQLYEPSGLEEMQELVKTLDNQKALGSRHCFNNIADSPLNQVSTKHLNKVLDIDETNHSVTIESGIRYGELAPVLEEKGFALHNLASLPHISVAGACSTATHGSGVNNGNLATAVNAIEFITANGEIVNLNREKDGDVFYGAVVGLGGLGIITKLSLDIEPTYAMRQDIFQELPLASLVDNFDEIMSSGYSVSLFTDWMNKKISQVWVKRKDGESTKELDKDYYGSNAATKNLHPITILSAVNCTDQMGQSGPWYERLPHFKMGFTPSSGEELQSEFFVARENAVDAILALEKKRDLIFPQLMISEIRTISADRLWMSPCYQQDSVAIHFTWKQNWEEVRKLLPMIEAELSPFAVRPHWGKLFTLVPEILRSRYERLPDFLALLKSYDPKGKFRNKYLDQNIYDS